MGRRATTVRQIPADAEVSTGTVMAVGGEALSPGAAVRYLTQEFWLNCLSMLALSAAVLLVSYAQSHVQPSGERAE